MPNTSEIQSKHPKFWEQLERAGIALRADPAQLDAPLLAMLRDKVGIRLETDDITLTAALLNLDEKDPVFKANHSDEILVMASMTAAV